MMRGDRLPVGYVERVNNELAMPMASERVEVLAVHSFNSFIILAKSQSAMRVGRASNAG